MENETTYTWKISNLLCEEDGIVRTVFWTLEAERSGFTERTSGSLSLGAPGDDPVPFPQLTQGLIGEWIEQNMEPGYPQQLKDFLSDQISYYERFSQPVLNYVGNEGLPWTEPLPSD